MTVEVKSGARAEITAANFQGLSIQQEVEVARALGLDLRKATREILVQDTLKLTDTIGELIDNENFGDPENFRRAAVLAERKKQIADILHGNSATKGKFATRIADNEFVLHLTGPTTEQSREEHIRSRLQSSPEEADALITSLREFDVDLSKTAYGPIEGVLRTDSNSKTRQQQRDLYIYGLAEPVTGVELAIEAVLQAREKNIRLNTINHESIEAKGWRVYQAAIDAGLPEGTATILKMLTTGAIHVEEKASHPVALSIIDTGRLHVYVSYGSGRSCWAFGSVGSSAK